MVNELLPSRTASPAEAKNNPTVTIPLHTAPM